MADGKPQPTDPSPKMLDRFIQHLRKRDQTFIESLGSWRRRVKTDHCVAADYLEALRAEVPHWQVRDLEPNDE